MLAGRTIPAQSKWIETDQLSEIFDNYSYELKRKTFQMPVIKKNLITELE